MVLLSDVYHTRRQRLHHVLDHTGTLCWSGQKIDEALTFLEDLGEYEFHLQGPDGGKPWEMMLHKP